MTVKEILESYEEITVEEQVLEGVLFFSLFEKKFLLFAPEEDDPSSKATVYLYNDNLLELPMEKTSQMEHIDGYVFLSKRA